MLIEAEDAGFLKPDHNAAAKAACETWMLAATTTCGSSDSSVQDFASLTYQALSVIGVDVDFSTDQRFFDETVKSSIPAAVKNKALLTNESWREGLIIFASKIVNVAAKYDVHGPDGLVTDIRSALEHRAEAVNLG